MLIASPDAKLQSYLIDGTTLGWMTKCIIKQSSGCFYLKLLTVPRAHTYFFCSRSANQICWWDSTGLRSAAYLGQWGRPGPCGVCYWPGRCKCRAPHRLLAPSRCGSRSHCCYCWPASHACPVTTCLSLWTGCWSGSARPCGSPPRRSDICNRIGSEWHIRGLFYVMFRVDT